MASSFLRDLDHTQWRITSVGLLWTSDQLVAETSTWQHITLTTNIHAPDGIRTHDLNRRAAADIRLRPRGYWDRHSARYLYKYLFFWGNYFIKVWEHPSKFSVWRYGTRTLGKERMLNCGRRPLEDALLQAHRLLCLPRAGRLGVVYVILIRNH